MVKQLDLEELIKQMRSEITTASVHHKKMIELFMKQAHLIGKNEQLDEVKTYQELIK